MRPLKIFNGLLTIYLIYGEPEHMKDDYLRDYIVPSNKMGDSFWDYELYKEDKDVSD